jgi:hypothetical protein
MVIQFESLFSRFGLTHCVIAFVKYEGNNLIITTFTLCFIIDCEPFKLIKVSKVRVSSM